MSVLFLDYDDTLFPTTQVILKNFCEEKINELEKKVIMFLSLSAEIFSGIYIVSNAMETWIRHTLQQYMKKLNDFIKTNKKIFVLSAADIFPKFDPVRRKENVFLTFLNCHDVKESMSIGDSNVESQAYKNAIKVLNADKKVTHLEKIIKLHESPDMTDMIFQIDYITKNLKGLCDENTSFEHSFSKIIEVEIA